MNIVEIFTHNYQGEIIKIEIEKVIKNKFIGHCKITMCNRSIEYNQAGTTPEIVKQKMIDFFTDKKVTKQLKVSNQ